MKKANYVPRLLCIIRNSPLLLAFFGLFMTSPAGTTGIPTIDIANILQTTITASKQVQQVTQLYQQIDNQISQIEKQAQAFENLNGNYLKHLLLNDSEYKAARRWAPKTYRAVLDLYKNIDVDGYEDAVIAGHEAADAMELVEEGLFFDDLDSRGAKRWLSHKVDNMAGVGVAVEAYERVDTLIEETESLMDDIENSTDAKAAADLANRMAGQTQLIMAELIRLSASNATTSAKNALHQQAMMGEDKKRAIGSDIPSLFTTEL